MDAVMSAVAITVILAAAPGAQEAGDSSTKGRIAAATESAARTGSIEEAAQATAPKVGRGRERRGTFGGYIEDAMVKSQVRIRFDAGFGINAPDRAEFFYAKCGCYVFDPVPWFDPDAPGPGPGVPTELNFQQLYVQGDYLIAPRLSLFAELPWRAIQPQGFEPYDDPPYSPSPDQSGLGDIRVGAKVALVADDTRDLTLQVRTGFPTGNASKGLSTDTVSLEPALLYSQDITDRFGWEAQLGAWFPFGGSVGVPDSNSPEGVPNPSSEKFSGSVIFYGIGPNFDLVRTDSFRLTPVLELVGWRVIGGAQTHCPNAVCPISYDADDNIVNLKLGARLTAGRSSFYAGYGWALTSAVWYDHVVRLEYRYRF
jgi:hypothetical protein